MYLHHVGFQNRIFIQSLWPPRVFTRPSTNEISQEFVTINPYTKETNSMPPPVKDLHTNRPLLLFVPQIPLFFLLLLQKCTWTILLLVNKPF